MMLFFPVTEPLEYVLIPPPDDELVELVQRFLNRVLLIKFTLQL